MDLYFHRSNEYIFHMNSLLLSTVLDTFKQYLCSTSSYYPSKSVISSRLASSALPHFNSFPHCSIPSKHMRNEFPSRRSEREAWEPRTEGPLLCLIALKGSEADWAVLNWHRRFVETEAEKPPVA